MSRQSSPMSKANKMTPVNQSGGNLIKQIEQQSSSKHGGGGSDKTIGAYLPRDSEVNEMVAGVGVGK